MSPKPSRPTVKGTPTQRQIDLIFCIASRNSAFESIASTGVAGARETRNRVEQDGLVDERREILRRQRG